MKNNIRIYDDLYNLVEADTENHALKNIAELFLNAMSDWPTFNLDDISQFVYELESYYGKPLTREKINSKKIKFDDISVWRNSSGSSIADVISVSETYIKEVNFEKIVSNIMEYYQNFRNDTSSR